MILPQIINKSKTEIEFDCGCKVPVKDGILQIDYDNLNKDCQSTYDLLSEGYNVGCFQLETNLGKHWSKEVKPRNIEDISLLISIIRPSTLNAKEANGHSVASNIIRKRNKEEEIVYPHPALEPILKPTYGYQNYQEQIMAVAQTVAGFDGNQADTLRKGIGKKLPEVIAKLKSEFFDGCKKVGLINEETATQLFLSIEAASRYSFNKCVSKTSTILFTDGTSDTVESLYNNGWTGKKTYSLEFYERPKLTEPYKNLIKHCNILENEIENIEYAGKQTVYCITLKRRLITDKYFSKNRRPNYSLIVTGTHKHPTRCHGLVKTDDLIPGKHSLYCYDRSRVGQPKYQYAASRVIKIECLGKDDVYNVTMKAPHHNFLCDSVFTCNSHSIAYGTQLYYTAWSKTHFPLEFYTANLRLNEDRGGKREKKEEEKTAMVREANEFGIKIIAPTIHFPCKTYSIRDNSTIVIGLANIKEVGESEAQITLDTYNSITNKRWLDILFFIGEKISSSSFKNICLSGFFNGCIDSISTKRMEYEYNTYRKLTQKELDWIKNRLYSFNSLESAIIELVESFNRNDKDKGISRKDRLPKINDLLKTLKNPPHSLEDTPLTINKHEKELFGIPITYSDIEARTLCNIQTDTTCKEFSDGKNSKEMSIAVSLTKVKEHKTSRGEMMAFCSCFDDTNTLESVVVFPSVYEDYSGLLTEKNTVVITGERSKDKKSFVVHTVRQI